MAQFYFVNSYVFKDSIYANAVYKIDIENKRIIDSVFFDEKGEFFAKQPTEVSLHNQQYLLSCFNSGLPAKNSLPGPYPVTYLNLLRYQNLNLIFIDSLIHSQVTGIKQIGDDTLYIEWFADNQTGGGNYISKFIFRSNVNRLEKTATIPNLHESHVIIGEYEDPVWLTNYQNINYYWDIVNGQNIALFKADTADAIIDETVIGDRTISNIAVGYSAFINKIICIKTPFKLLSYSPPYESPENVEAEVIYFSMADFTIENTFSFEMGDVYCGYDVGEAFSQGPYLYYYYFAGDGYGQFDPAYLLIFDTRTNEASWLRVGWR